MNEKVLRLIGNPGLIFVAVLVGYCFSLFVGNYRGEAAGAVVFGVVCVSAVVALWLHNRWRDAILKRQEDAKLKKLEEENNALRRAAEHPHLSVVDKDFYPEMIRHWNDSGKGRVFLFNIELQSFENDEVIRKTWGQIADLTNVREVILLLPPTKARRWERVVLEQEHKFFGNRANRKFLLCEIDESPAEMRSATAFAIYRHDRAELRNGPLDERGLMFILSPPFSERRAAFVATHDEWWDYVHLIQFDSRGGFQQILSEIDEICSRALDPGRIRSVDRVLADCKPLVPIEPVDFFTRLGVLPGELDDLMVHFAPRTVAERLPSRVSWASRDGSGEFKIIYDNHQTVRGRYSGLGDSPKRAIVWVGGFTERLGSRLPYMFEKVLKKEDVVQFYYEVSSPLEHLSLSRYMQDMREVLRYVNEQARYVLSDQTVLIARSINALLAALVASETTSLDMLAGLILVAPVFDAVQMIDNYCTTRLGRPDVRVEKAWRFDPKYPASAWTDPRNRWLEFFNRQISLVLLADIIRHDKEYFSIESFKHAIGRISKHCPVYVLSNRHDPVTGSQQALDYLEKAATGGGLIEPDNFKHLEIPGKHLPSVDRDSYPFDDPLDDTRTDLLRDPRSALGIRAEIYETRKALHEILVKLGLPTVQQVRPGERSATSKVLIVEPDAERRERLCRDSQSDGNSVCCAGDCDAAANAVQASDFDLAIVDVELMGTKAIDFPQRVRQARSAASPFLVAIAGTDLSDDEAKAVTTAYDDVIQYPPSGTAFSRILGKKKPR